MSMTFEQMQELLTQTAMGLAETNKALADTNKALNRVEAIAESNARAIQATANKLDEKFDQIANAIIRDQEMITKLDRRYRKQQAEIKGLRLETRRILERWLGEPFPDDPDLDDED
ncbi:hypothetical protein [Pseudanabaena cinerea]|jgi:hypothetical protein|nr:hypothetical protein [Pseudanabaena cinerea]